MSSKPKKESYTLGLDIGIEFVGAALLAKNKILNLYVRTFDKLEVAKDGKVLNTIRRNARLKRRRIRRKAHRLLRLCRKMKREGLIDIASPNAFKMTGSPWKLRNEGLYRKLSSLEWASVIYHLIKHRGFQSNRKSEEKTDSNVGRMLEGIAKNNAILKEKKYRTIGEMFWKESEFSESKRNKRGKYNRTIGRKEIASELDLLFRAQRFFKNQYTSEDFEKFVQKLLLQRRPTVVGERLVETLERCIFEPEEFRAPRASYSVERFVWLTKLNNLCIFESGKSRSLDESERQLLINLPFIQTKLTYKQIRDSLELSDQATFNPPYYRKKDHETATFFEAKFFHAIRKEYDRLNLKKEWEHDRNNEKKLNDIAYALTVYKDDESAKAYMLTKGIEEKIADAVLNCSFSGFAHLSQKALQKIIPYMEKGEHYDQAVQSVGYAHHSQKEVNEKTGYLPEPKGIKNPVLFRAVNQARKLINAIIREYGLPKAVHIELARDISKPFDERKRIERNQKTYQTEKIKARKRFIKNYKRDPKGVDLLKEKLYHEQEGKSAYSQNLIDIRRITEDGYVQLDHILPYSRSYDDSLNNKVLVLTRENQEKGNKTPWEYLGGKENTEAWQRFKSWVFANKNFREAKRNRLLISDFSEREEVFQNRNLYDTRYISRKLKSMIKTYLKLGNQTDDQNYCVAVNSNLTSFLRSFWGVVHVCEGSDLRYALNASVVASCSSSLVKQISDYFKHHELKYVENSFVDMSVGEIITAKSKYDVFQHQHKKIPLPWPEFRNELLARLKDNPSSVEKPNHYTLKEWQDVKPIQVSRMPKRRNLGAAHRETIRSLHKIKNEQGQEDQYSSIKVELTNLKREDLENIVSKDRDTVLYKVICNRMKSFNYNAKKAFAVPIYKSKDGEFDGKASQIKSVKIMRRQPSGVLVRGGIADNDTMIRVDIFTKGEGKQKRFFSVPVYISDLVKKEFPNRVVVQGKQEKDWDVVDDSYSFLFSLYPNDWVEIKLKNSIKKGYYVGLDRSSGTISLLTHDRNMKIGKDGLLRSIGIKVALEVAKYHVDILGNLYRVYYEERKFPKFKN